MPEPGEAGVDALLGRADAIAAGARGRARHASATFDAGELATFMTRLAELEDVVGRADNYAGLDFSVDTTDPARGALMQKVEERGTAIATTLLFFELEWAAVPDDRAEALLADDGSRSPRTTSGRRGATGRICCPSPKRSCSPRSP